MSQITQTIGIRLRQQRSRRGYSQERLAELAGLHPTYIGQIERGEKNLTVESLSKITQALGVPMSQLLEKLMARRGRTAMPCGPMSCSAPWPSRGRKSSIRFCRPWAGMGKKGNDKGFFLCYTIKNPMG